MHRAIVSLGSLLLLLFLVVPGAWAQGADENVHVTPHAKKDESKLKVPEAAKDEPQLRPKTYKKDVDLVLVNVTVTDPMNRLVTGLEQDNFTISEGDQL